MTEVMMDKVSWKQPHLLGGDKIRLYLNLPRQGRCPPTPYECMTSPGDNGK